MFEESDGDGAAALAALLAATARGDRAAFSRLYAATSQKLYGVALRILGRRELADDALQEAYLRIWRNAGRYAPARGCPITWMVIIARNAAIDILRSRRHEAKLDDDALPAIASTAPSAFDEISMSQERRRAFAALRSLDPAKRELILAAYLHGESRRQLAVRFGVSVNTVKTRLRRAMIEFNAAYNAFDERQVA